MRECFQSDEVSSCPTRLFVSEGCVQLFCLFASQSEPVLEASTTKRGEMKTIRVLSALWREIDRRELAFVERSEAVRGVGWNAAWLSGEDEA